MTTLSFPTKASVLFDVPEPGNITGKFIYRYYQRDERSSMESWSDMVNNYAREISLNFTPINDAVTLGNQANPMKLSEREKHNILTQNLKFLVSENQAMGQSFVGAYVQDPAAMETLQSAVLAEVRQNAANAAGITNTQQALTYINQQNNQSNNCSFSCNIINSWSEYCCFGSQTCFLK